MREREIDGGVSGWEKEGDWKREREIEREGGVKQMCQNCIPTMNMNTLWEAKDHLTNEIALYIFCNIIHNSYV